MTYQEKLGCSRPENELLHRGSIFDIMLCNPSVSAYVTDLTQRLAEAGAKIAALEPLRAQLQEAEAERDEAVRRAMMRRENLDQLEAAVERLSVAVVEKMEYLESMRELEALRRLHDLCEHAAGPHQLWELAEAVGLSGELSAYVLSAHMGNYMAARELLEALLPGHELDLRRKPKGSYEASVYPKGEPADEPVWSSGRDDAVALLRAILRALIQAKVGGVLPE